MTSLLDVIRDAVETSGRTRYDISKDSGVSQGQLSRFVHGAQGISVENVEKLAECLGLEIIIRPKGRARKAVK